MLTQRMNSACAPWRGQRARTDLDRVLNSFFEGFPAYTHTAFAAPTASPAMPVNAWEDDSSVFVEAELPGYSMERVEVTFEKNELTITAKREASAEEKGESFLRRERSVGEVTRTLGVETEIDTDQVSATLRDGVLLVTLPKSKATRARKIDVRGA